MKKTLILVGVLALSMNAMAQDVLKEAACKSTASTLEKALKDSENPKKATKSATFVSLADAYMDDATQCGKDSMASKKAYSTLQKALEIENAAGGKKSKTIEDALSGQKLYGALLQQGAAFYNGQNTTSAAELFDLSSVVNPKDTTAALYSGIANQAIQNSDKAKAAFHKYINNGGKDPAVFFSLAQILKIEKKYDESLAVLNKGIAVNPTDKDLKNEVVNVYLVSENIDGAIKSLEENVAKDPKNVGNLANLGLLYDNKAQDIAAKLSKLKAKNSNNGLASLESNITKKTEEAAAYESEITRLKKSPTSANRAKIAEYLQKIPAIKAEAAELTAELATKKAEIAKNAPNPAEIAKLEANLKSEKGNAINTYKKVLAIDPDNYDVNFNFAVMHFNEAVETKKAIDAMDIKTYQASGKEIEQKACGQFAASKPYFDKCLQIKPDDEFVSENITNLERILSQCN